MIEPPDVRPIFWLAAVGLIALGVGAIWLVWFLVTHVSVVVS